MTRSNLRVKLRRIGTGQGVLISRSVCQIMGLNIGDEMILEMDDNGIILRTLDGDQNGQGQ